jgi:hypothetical protein
MGYFQQTQSFLVKCHVIRFDRRCDSFPTHRQLQTAQMFPVTVTNLKLMNVATRPLYVETVLF